MGHGKRIDDGFFEFFDDGVEAANVWKVSVFR
jgi:hypothetical protein